MIRDFLGRTCKISPAIIFRGFYSVPESGEFSQFITVPSTLKIRFFFKSSEKNSGFFVLSPIEYTMESNYIGDEISSPSPPFRSQHWEIECTNQMHGIIWNIVYDVNKVRRIRWSTTEKRSLYNSFEKYWRSFCKGIIIDHLHVNFCKISSLVFKNWMSKGSHSQLVVNNCWTSESWWGT